jgi:hypothetical protein
LPAQLSRFRCGHVLDCPDRTADESQGIGEIVQRRSSYHASGVGVVDVVGVRDGVWSNVKNVLEVYLVVDQVLRDVGQPLNLLRGLVAGAFNKPLHLAHGDRQI